MVCGNSDFHKLKDDNSVHGDKVVLKGTQTRLTSLHA